MSLVSDPRTGEEGMERKQPCGEFGHDVANIFLLCPVGSVSHMATGTRGNRRCSASGSSSSLWQISEGRFAVSGGSRDLGSDFIVYGM